MNIGKLPVNVLKHSVLKQIHAYREEMICGAGLGGDCAIFSCPSSEILATCAREAAVATKAATEADGPVPGAATTSMNHLLIKAANNLAAGGAKPIFFELVLLLPPETEADEIRDLMAEADSTCQFLQMQLIGGQTRVTDAVNRPVACVTAYGFCPGDAIARGSQKKSAFADLDIVITKQIGLEGTQLLAMRRRDLIDSRYPAYLTREAAKYDAWLSICQEAEIAAQSGAVLMHDLSEGGILATLWELGEAAGCGMEIDMKRIPVKQETIEICEVCGVNPYEMLSGGALLILTKDGDKLIGKLREAGIDAQTIGKTTADAKRILKRDEEVRYLDRPAADALYTN